MGSNSGSCLFLPFLICGGWILWVIIFGSCIIPGVVLLHEAEGCLSDPDCDENSVEYESNTGTILVAIGGIPAVVTGVPFLCITLGVIYKMFCVAAGCDT